MDTEHGKVGRPRSERAREAVLHAVDDLLVETGYAAMTMKGIAERAGVSRQTVYRWWSTKAEILLEASAADAEGELAVAPTGDALGDLTAYLEALVNFLANSPAGAAYRALLGEAQHDPEVAKLLATKDVLGDSARQVLTQALPPNSTPHTLELATTRLIGPVFFTLMTARDPAHLNPTDLARTFLATRES
ncbi:TetR/AcrR family transcriptional regulator [Kribbella sp. NBC_01505]|uniref:TetR/AcrR family transcriptional regulator n=1 Tax=Kribbella sp. NBC_01505 TaxID=2903580 RepID=UPI0038696556